MASGEWGAALRHLRGLFRGGSAVGLDDGQLLARYAASNDGEAFEALVVRHGPMVLTTCRAVLGNEHDVEDAFQATFLVLARKARSVRAGEALGGWLHRVAYRVAVEAGAEARRRRLREAKVAAMAAREEARQGPEPEVRAILHEEIDRLPEGQRLPVVLCDLEGLTYEQAAHRLDWTVPTLRCRLSKARKRLRARLTRRGVTAAMAGSVLAQGGASAAVPDAWTRAATASATGGMTSVTVTALARTILRSMVMSKLKFAATAALGAAVLVSAGVVALGARRVDEPAPEKKAEAPPAAEAKAAGETGAVEVRGRVVGPDGTPVPGATLKVAFLDMDDRRKVETSSGTGGRFLVRVPPLDPSMLMLNGGPSFPWLVASAPGFGPTWVPGALKLGAEGELTVRLVEDGPPIEGRIVDLEGRPVAGARIKVGSVYYAFGTDRYRDIGDLSAWLKVVKDRGVQGPWDGLDALPISIATETGPDGRFRLTGIGRERVADLLVSGPAIATTQVFAMCRNGPEARCSTRSPGGVETLVFHAPRFEHAVAPCQPVEGVVRDAETGRPVAGVHLRGGVFHENSGLWVWGVEATTDTQGRYRLAGLPKSPAYQVFVEPAEGQPYPRLKLKVPAGSPGLTPVAFDINLRRGILVRGRVTDKATGRPVPGYVEAFTFSDNPHVREFPGYEESYPPHVYLKDDGRYELVALPGRGLVACRSDIRYYRGRLGAEAIAGYNPEYGGFLTLPHDCGVANFHIVAAVDLDPKAESATLDLQVDPGRSVSLTVVDPEGKPVAGARGMGLHDLFRSSEAPLESPTFEVHALDPSKPRRVTVTHADRKLIGSVTLKGDEPGPLTLRLRPWGTFAGRVVDGAGKPRAGLRLRLAPASDRSDGGPSLEAQADGDGRFRVEGVVPEVEYEVTASGERAGSPPVELTVAPGEVKDVGDLKLAPRR